uniref:Putative secreted protein n=1 Tax=Ixodes ricinus TaxID=34613 RepID=A0A6B0UH27_IXORI
MICTVKSLVFFFFINLSIFLRSLSLSAERPITTAGKAPLSCQSTWTMAPTARGAADSHNSSMYTSPTTSYLFSSSKYTSTNSPSLPSLRSVIALRAVTGDRER